MSDNLEQQIRPSDVEASVFRAASRAANSRHAKQILARARKERQDQMALDKNIAACARIVENLEIALDHMRDPRKFVALLERNAEESENEFHPNRTHILLWVDTNRKQSGPFENPDLPDETKVPLNDFCRLIEQTDAFNKLRKRLERAGIDNIRVQFSPIAFERNRAHMRSSVSDIFVGGHAVILSYSTQPLRVIEHYARAPFNPYLHDYVWFAKEVADVLGSDAKMNLRTRIKRGAQKLLGMQP